MNTQKLRDMNLGAVADELEAMKQVAEALSGLEDDAIRRVLSWASDHFSVKIKDSGSTANKR